MTNISKCLEYNEKFMVIICNKYNKKHFQLPTRNFENLCKQNYLSSLILKKKT